MCVTKPLWLEKSTILYRVYSYDIRVSYKSEEVGLTTPIVERSPITHQNSVGRHGLSVCKSRPFPPNIFQSRFHTLLRVSGTRYRYTLHIQSPVKKSIKITSTLLVPTRASGVKNFTDSTIITLETS